MDNQGLPQPSQKPSRKTQQFCSLECTPRHSKHRCLSASPGQVRPTHFRAAADQAEWASNLQSSQEENSEPLQITFRLSSSSFVAPTCDLQITLTFNIHVERLWKKSSLCLLPTTSQPGPDHIRLAYPLIMSHTSMCQLIDSFLLWALSSDIRNILFSSLPSTKSPYHSLAIGHRVLFYFYNNYT